MRFKKIKDLREKQMLEMKDLVKDEVAEYVEGYFKENENVVLIKIQGDDYMNDDGEESKIVCVKVEMKDDKWEDYDDSPSGHEEMIQDDLDCIVDEIYYSINKTYKRKSNG